MHIASVHIAFVIHIMMQTSKNTDAGAVRRPYCEGWFIQLGVVSSMGDGGLGKWHLNMYSQSRCSGHRKQNLQCLEFGDTVVPSKVKIKLR